jgi:hypothetical protein
LLVPAAPVTGLTLPFVDQLSSFVPLGLVSKCPLTKIPSLDV